MAPTICSEKKPRQIRTNLKEIRRQPNAASALAASASAAASASSVVVGVAALTNGNGSKAPIASSNINYGSGCRNLSAMHVRSKIDNSAVDKPFPVPLRMSRLNMERDQQQQQQISDNVVSSSTTGPELLRVLTADQMDLDDDITDEEDCEVHSITSGAHCYNNNSSNNNNNVRARTLLQCNIESVFIAPTLHSKQLLPPPTNNANNNSTNNTNNNNNTSHIHHKKRPYGSDKDENDSDTYSSLCEIKNTEGLLAIALKTIKLVKRNQLLQRRLAELQIETSEFIQSVLANPENRHIRDNMQSPTSAPSSPSVTSATSPTATSLAMLQSPTTTTTTTTTAVTTLRPQSIGRTAEV